LTAQLHHAANSVKQIYGEKQNLSKGGSCEQ